MLHFVQTYGVWLLAVLIALECSGIPLPGETSLIGWALYAATLHAFDIWLVIVAAVIGAITGNIIGYLIGRSVGYRIVLRYGCRIGLSESRFKIGHYLFNHYGIAAVMGGRFLPLLRSALPILAGANRMAFWPFLFASVAGGIAWVTLVGLAAFYFGVALVQLSSTAMISVGSVVLLIAVFIILFIRRHEGELLVKAEQEIPGPLPRNSIRSEGTIARLADSDRN